MTIHNDGDEKSAIGGVDEREQWYVDLPRLSLSIFVICRRRVNVIGYFSSLALFPRFLGQSGRF